MVIKQEFYCSEKINRRFIICRCGREGFQESTKLSRSMKITDDMSLEEARDDQESSEVSLTCWRFARFVAFDAPNPPDVGQAIENRYIIFLFHISRDTLSSSSPITKYC